MVVFVITDFDPTGVIIAAQVEEQIQVTVPDIEIVRLGMDPDHKALTAATTGEELDTTHAKSRIWQDACARYGTDDRYQAEALDYETWADIVASAVEERLAGRPVNASDHDPEFVNADRVLAAVRSLVDESASLGELADRLQAL
jgi:hypothetical protein